VKRLIRVSSVSFCEGCFNWHEKKQLILLGDWQTEKRHAHHTPASMPSGDLSAARKQRVMQIADSLNDE